MRLLRVLGLVLVHPRLGRDVFRAVSVLDRIARHGHSLGGHVDAVGPHICNVAGLVEALRARHALPRAHAELAAGLLLQGRGHERRGRVARGRFGLDRLDFQIAAVDGLNGHFGLRLIFEVVFVELLARQIGQPRLVFLPAGRGEDGFDRPVFAGPKRLDLHLAFGEDAQAHRLHAARGFRARQLAPQHRRQVEADEIIKRAAGQIRLDQRHVDLARVLHRLGHSRLGDCVEGDALDVGVFLDRFALGQRLLEVPADRLTFAVGVGGEDQRVVVLERIGDGLDVFLAVAGHLPQHVKFVVRVDRAILGWQVAHVPVAGQNGIVVTQILVDGLRFGWGFDNDNWHLRGHLGGEI